MLPFPVPKYSTGKNTYRLEVSVANEEEGRQESGGGGGKLRSRGKGKWRKEQSQGQGCATPRFEESPLGKLQAKHVDTPNPFTVLSLFGDSSKKHHWED